MSHYKYLEQHLENFLAAMGVNPNHGNAGLIGAHGDKCYGYMDKWQRAGIPFEHGVAIYLLTYVRPYGLEVRDTPDGFVKVDDWVIDNYDRFKDFLPPPRRLSDESDEDLAERLWACTEKYNIGPHALEILNAVDRGYVISDEERQHLEDLVELFE